MRKPGLWIAVLGLLIGMLWSQPSLAGVRVYVKVPPPPLIVETAPVAPSPRHVWIGGYHRWDGRAYVWNPGRYEIPPRRHTRWVAGHWAQHRNGHYWVEGRWR